MSGSDRTQQTQLRCGAAGVAKELGLFEAARPIMDSHAVISGCGRYRYELGRRWADGPALEWVMLNPSTADADQDDPTIRRCSGFAKRWGYGAIIVHNLYAYRATDPQLLANLDDPIGPDNHRYLASCHGTDGTVVAWGSDPAATGWWNGYPYAWQQTVLQRPQPLLCLGVNANGSPKHPLYVPANRTPIPWTASPRSGDSYDNTQSSTA